ncbi:double-strand break repair protein AddB [Brevundimonas sp. SORGH_AS_0993]|uniref:double-strand break repair protein AddB n=1 Tax=Brevundimonas sp. SORGH_AS_0993 TaxID=3041794 RepID=UPI00277D39B9|nr:double-strand break repair protein AddB [Brevundimonas sp. SORGH_AS_0993]MDQ1155231.1 ATP-dependent helicase/nuclease subunit B [Brevundimonas sp. SORGH_AS_0993]
MRPRWYAIPAHRPFLEDLAAGVLAWLGDRPPETLSDATILLPNRRAARAFTGALSRIAGDRPVLLPQVRPLGDLEEDEPPFTPGALGLDLPPAIAPLTRRFEMARMIVERFDADLTPMRALDLADALGGFLDSCQLEDVRNPERVAALVEGEMAEHWERSAEFLSLGVVAWPERLAELGLVDPAWRRATLLKRLAELWDADPPGQPVIAAGSTGTVPAAADVLGAVARAPQGCVVLPGLDLDLDERVWAQIDADNEQHPQRALKRLLERHDIPRAAVRPWFRPAVAPASEARGLARQRLLNEALRPADATGDWRAAIRDIRARAAQAGRAADPIAEGLEGLSVLTLRHEEETAAAIALMMRETLETPNADGTGRTCALVTPDQALGRRVAARLERWGIIPDSSAGQPLDRMPAGVLVGLCARWMAAPTDPQVLLGLLKHPLTRLELEGVDIAHAAEALERLGLRGPRQPRFDRLNQRLDKALKPDRDGAPPSEGRIERHAAARALSARLEALVTAARAPFATDDPQKDKAPLDAAARALTALVEALAGQNAWAGPDGECAAGLLSDLIAGGAALGAVTPADLVELVAGLLAEAVVRTGGATHPSLRILGAIEARLVRADRMILAGLEEGVWPQGAPVDPFLSRPMRAALDLPPPERRIGQSAQDFVQAACADEAILVHTERRGGQPSVRSRWLWRLDMLTRGADAPATPVAVSAPTRIATWTRALDAPARATPDYARRPAPTPPVARRPRELPVTGVERWVRDPYAVYAQRILGLTALDRPGASAEAMARGDAVHAAIEQVVRTWPQALPEDCAGQIETFLMDALTEAGFEDAALARERPLARNCARWLAAFERERRARGASLMIEQSGAMTFDAPGGPFTLTARADRIELDATGAAVIDFKTGATPSQKQVVQGFAPQLTLTAAILADGGFPAPPTEATELLYVKVTGRREPGVVTDVSKQGRSNSLTAAQLAERELDRLKQGVAAFDDPSTPYRSWVAPQFMGGFGGNYDHLARVWEWHVVGGEDEAPE